MAGGRNSAVIAPGNCYLRVRYSGLEFPIRPLEASTPATSPCGHVPRPTKGMTTGDRGLGLL